MFELFNEEKPTTVKFSWKSKIIEIIITALLTATFIELSRNYIFN